MNSPGPTPTLTVCTGWNPEGYRLYGRRFAESFARHMPATVDLVVYGEEPVKLPRGEFRPLAEIAGCVEFLQETVGLPVANGRERLPGQNWKFRAVQMGYNWRYDARKFSRQAFIPWDCGARCNTPYMAWFDGDVVFHHDVTAGLIEALLPADKSVAYVGREPGHPDLAFHLYRLRGKGAGAAQSVLGEFVDMYRSRELFSLKEWHSAWLWREAVRRVVRRCGPAFLHNLTPGGTGHVWHESPLRTFSDHLKGERKRAGRSPERR